MISRRGFLLGASVTALAMSAAAKSLPPIDARIAEAIVDASCLGLGDKILFTNQANPAHNGVYIVTESPWNFCRFI